METMCCVLRGGVGDGQEICRIENCENDVTVKKVAEVVGVKPYGMENLFWGPTQKGFCPSKIYHSLGQIANCYFLILMARDINLIRNCKRH